MVSQALAAGRPRVSAGLIVDVNDEFTHDHSVCKGNDSPVTFEFTVYYEPGYQTLIDRAYIADCVSNNFFIPLDFDFFVDSSHSVVLRTFDWYQGSPASKHLASGDAMLGAATAPLSLHRANAPRIK